MLRMWAWWLQSFCNAALVGLYHSRKETKAFILSQTDSFKKIVSLESTKQNFICVNFEWAKNKKKKQSRGSMKVSSKLGESADLMRLH